MADTLLIPAVSTVCIFKTWLMRCRNRPAAGLLDDVGFKAVLLCPFIRNASSEVAGPPVLDSEGIQDSIAVAVINGRLFLCL